MFTVNNISIIIVIACYYFIIIIVKDDYMTTITNIANSIQVGIAKLYQTRTDGQLHTLQFRNHCMR